MSRRPARTALGRYLPVLAVAALALGAGGYALATWGSVEALGPCLHELQCREYPRLEPPTCERLEQRDVCMIPCGSNIRHARHRGLGSGGPECPAGLVCTRLGGRLRGRGLYVPFDADYCMPRAAR